MKTIIISIVSIIIGLLIGFNVAPTDNTDHKEEMSDMPKEEMEMHESSEDMDSTMMDMSARLEGKTGDELDQIFLEDMIVHHQGAVDMAEILLEGTERQEMKDFANEIISVQANEIEMMGEWLEMWFMEKNEEVEQ